MANETGPGPNDLRIDSAYLEHLNLLEKSGALDDISALRKENRELDTLLNDAAALVSLPEIDTMIDFVISRLLERFIPTHLMFLIETPRGGGFSHYSYHNLKKDERKFPTEYYQVLKSFFTASPYPIAYGELERRIGPEGLGAVFRDFDPEVLFPMRGLGVLYGLVLLGRKIAGGEYTEPEKMYVDRMTRFLSIGIQNSLHHESSITDLKTGLYNHYHFMQRLEQEITRISRHGSRAGILMLDIDHFKVFNDTWGHLAGDEILVAIAATIKRTIRAEDMGARFGGEEFCVLAVECDEKILFDMAERIRQAIESLTVPFGGEALGVTTSIGCYQIEGPGPIRAETCLGRADRALYLSKAGGRNRSTLYRPGLLGRATALRQSAEPGAGRRAGPRL
ncbi:MAG TPA: GGDEF domain-containing protein [Rectinemataceae bacterium]|nr:GGDEF domain-containing protein [Rectinemataceae bacterium]